MFRPGFRCDSHTAYVSVANGPIPDIATKTLSVDDEYANNYENVIAIDATEEGKYKWRVDCSYNGKVKRGKTWKFFVKH